MNHPRIHGKTIVALAGAMLLCGSMSFAQAPRGSSGQSSQAPGQTPPGQTPSLDPQLNGAQSSGQASPQDRLFVSRALAGGMAEVQLGQLTLQKSDNQQVKQFAQRMIDDHTKLGEQMKPVAEQIGVSVPTKISKKDKTTLAKLGTLSGSAYDQAYIKDMVKDHKQDLSEFQLEASSGQDQTVKDAASQGSQLIAQHLQMIQQIAKDQNITPGQ
jgi:putative membrane protein